jgi:hypothetical protein
MLRFHGVVVAAGVAAAMLSGASALADSRIFTVKASEPGVTIEQAFRNGKELAVVGRGDGNTLFRVDEPSTIVACANRFDFVTSTGEKVNLAADMCVLNWEVTVDVAAAPAPAAETPAAAAGTEEPAAPEEPPATAAEAPDLPAIPPPPAVPESADADAPPAATTTPGAFTQVVTVAADDPSVTITGLSLDGAPVRITGRVEGNVQFEIAGSEQGIVCQRDLGLTLSDGRQVTQAVNLCLNDWQVEVAVAGAAPGATLTAPPPPPPGAPGTGVTALPAPTAEGMAWTFAAGEIAGTLVYGIPETDATAFVATCNRGSDRITVTLYDATAPGLQPGAAVPVTFIAGGFTKAYQGTMTAVSEESGVSNPEVVISAGDPLWSALIHESNLGIAAGPAYSATLSLKGSAAPARQLLATCLNAPAPPPAAAPVVVAPGGGLGGNPGGPGITALYGCEIGPGFRVTYFGNRGIAVLDEQGAPPLTLQWAPEGALGRYIAGEARLVLREDHVRWSRFGERARTCFPR